MTCSHVTLSSLSCADRRLKFPLSVVFRLDDLKVDEALRRILGPDLLSVLCVITVSAVSIVAVWKVTSACVRAECSCVYVACVWVSTAEKIAVNLVDGGA